MVIKKCIKEYLTKRMPRTKLDKIFENLDNDYVPETFKTHAKNIRELQKYISKTT
jgi:arsenate reductase-like glutaredoxin family protein